MSYIPTNAQNVNSLNGAVTPRLHRNQTWAEQWAPFASELIPIRAKTKRPAISGWSAPDYVGTLEQLRGWESIGMLGRRHPAVDIDVTVPLLTDMCERIALEMLGSAPVRGRPGSPKCLLIYRTSEELRKRRIEFTMANGTKHAVELLATGQQYVVEGIHPDGQRYGWDVHPSEFELTEITADAWDRYCDELGQQLRALECVVHKDGRGGATRTGGHVRPREALLAPDGGAHDPIAAMRAWKERHEDKEIRHDRFIDLCAAFRGAAGDFADELFDDFRECLPAPRDTEENTEKTFFSFDAGVRLGWSALCSITGYVAPDTFDDAPPAGSTDAPDPSKVARQIMLARYVYVRDVDCFFDLEEQKAITGTQFDRDNRQIAPPGSTGIKAAHNIFLRQPEHHRARAITYAPGAAVMTQEELGGQLVDCVNSWRTSLLKPTAGDVTPWLNHLTMVTEPEGPEARDHLLDCMAHGVQKRGAKRNHAIMLYSETEGVGKDTAIEPLLQIIGKHNCGQIEEATLQNDFNGWLRNELIVVHEVWHLSKSDITRVKGYIAATPGSTVRINEKNQRAYDIPNRQNWIMYSNKPDALALSGSDRRFWVCRCIEKAQPKEYFDRLYDWYDNQGGYSKVYGYLMARDISRFNPMAHPPMTKAKREMIDLARPEHERWLEEQFGEGGAFASRTILTVAEITGGIWDAPHGLNSKNVSTALQTAGFERGPQVKLDGKGVTVWLRGRTLLAKDSPKTLKEMLTKERAETAADTAASEAATGW
jgi:Family of unknown function (DUF5906)